MNRDQFWLTDVQFSKIEPHLPTDTRGKRGETNQAIGRSRGGRTTKIHALTVDGRLHRGVLLLGLGELLDVVGGIAQCPEVPAAKKCEVAKTMDVSIGVHNRTRVHPCGCLVCSIYR